MLYDLAGYHRGEQRVARGGHPHRGHQVLRRRVLHQEAAGHGLQGLEHVVDVERGKHDHLRRARASQCRRAAAGPSLPDMRTSMSTTSGRLRSQTVRPRHRRRHRRRPQCRLRHRAGRLARRAPSPGNRRPPRGWSPGSPQCSRPYAGQRDGGLDRPAACECRAGAQRAAKQGDPPMPNDLCPARGGAGRRPAAAVSVTDTTGCPPWSEIPHPRRHAASMRHDVAQCFPDKPVGGQLYPGRELGTGGQPSRRLPATAHRLARNQRHRESTTARQRRPMRPSWAGQPSARRRFYAQRPHLR